MSKYTIGIDFGTLSGRSVLVDIENGDTIASSEYIYSNKVITTSLPGTNVKLKKDYALQDPQDYLNVLYKTIPEVIKLSGVEKEDIIGLAIDFTASTVVAVDEDNIPLCFHAEFRNNPHAWVKLWKHHAAQKYANQINDLAHSNNEEWINRYGGKISSEWLFPKILQVLVEDEEIYDATDNYLEATDWVTSQLTGNVLRNTCTLGYKAIYHHKKGFPKPAFFKKLHPKFETVVKDKIKGDIKSIGEKAGNITDFMAKQLGLSVNTVVAVGNVDAHVSAPAVNVVEPGSMLMIMGTSTCDILLDDKEVYVPGICGVVYDGVIPGYYGYESGQNAVGDIFAWFVDNYLNEKTVAEAKKDNLSVHQLLERKAEKLKVGESGLISLDWHGGNRSILVDTDLQGMIIGLTLHTKPEEIYRSLIEATAFGKRIIIENYKKYGVAIKKLYVCGGLPNKNKLLLQIYADVLNMEITIADSLQTPALGSAIYASLAAKENGGYQTILEASNMMSKVKAETVKPNVNNVLKYNKLYDEYHILHDYFGYDNNVMKRLKKGIEKEK